MKTRGQRELAVTLHWARFLLQAPVGIYRARLGLIMGNRFLMVEHIGGPGGMPRYAVLEVIGRPDSEHYMVVADFGHTSQWLRNVRRDGAARVSVGRRHLEPASARVLDEAEARRELAAYAISQPQRSRMLLLALTGDIEDPLYDLIELATVLPVVEFDLSTARAPGDVEG